MKIPLSLIIGRIGLTLSIVVYVIKLSANPSLRLGYSIESLNALFFIASTIAIMAYIIGIMLTFVNMYFSDGKEGRFREMIASLFGLIILTILYLR